MLTPTFRTPSLQHGARGGRKRTVCTMCWIQWRAVVRLHTEKIASVQVAMPGDAPEAFRRR